jgi:hypothetical protein
VVGEVEIIEFSAARADMVSHHLLFQERERGKKKRTQVIR